MRTRRKFDPEFKARVVLELSRGEDAAKQSLWLPHTHLASAPTGCYDLAITKPDTREIGPPRGFGEGEPGWSSLT
ncbi:MAG: hypothetical protein M3Z19_04510 [Chloroflexota bacterium]|nr:hypothetical protein [Chloroflexota bacterium]